MLAFDPQGPDKFAPKGLDWQDLYISYGPHGFIEDSLCFPFNDYKS